MVETSVLGCVFWSMQVILKDSPDSQIFWSVPVCFCNSSTWILALFWNALWEELPSRALSASSIVFTNSNYVTFISSLPFSCQGAKADSVFEMPSCSLVRHQSIWRCPVGVLALTKVYLEMESCCAFGPQQTQCFTVIKGRSRTVHLYVTNE